MGFLYSVNSALWDFYIQWILLYEIPIFSESSSMVFLYWMNRVLWDFYIHWILFYRIPMFSDSCSMVFLYSVILVLWYSYIQWILGWVLGCLLISLEPWTWYLCCQHVVEIIRRTVIESCGRPAYSWNQRLLLEATLFSSNPLPADFSPKEARRGFQLPDPKASLSLLSRGIFFLESTSVSVVSDHVRLWIGLAV